MRAISLQSGSNGNCIFVESNGTRLLFDAGISGIQAEKRLAEHGLDIRDIDALIISHDHADHISCAGIYHRKYGIPVFMTEITYNSACRYGSLGRIDQMSFFDPGDVLNFGGTTVETIPTPHDAAEGSAFIVEHMNSRLGILTDLGHVFDGLQRVMPTLDAVFIESNYDPRMLETGPYPAFLKKRIKGSEGHLSNIDASELLCLADPARMQWACLSHLSENNNDPVIALRTARDIAGGSLSISAASRYGSSGVLYIEPALDQLTFF